MHKIEKLLEYQYTVQCQIHDLIMQSNPFTAVGEGLDKISRALGLGGRYDVPKEPIPYGGDEPTRLDEYRSETDGELRNRILDYLRD